MYVTWMNASVPDRLLIDYEPRDVSGNLDVWNGRGGSPYGPGNIVGASPYVYEAIVWTQELTPNIIVLKGNDVAVTSLTADPYILYPIYGTVTNLQFNIGRPAKVNIIIKDSGGQVIRNLVTDQMMPVGQNTVLWDLRDNYGNVVTKHDNYQIYFSAVDPMSQAETVRIGNVTIYK
jgi:hypothetical protein